MPRPTSRCHLESGIKLDLNRLARRGFIQPGTATGPIGIKWTFNYTDEETVGVITADMSDAIEITREINALVNKIKEKYSATEGEGDIIKPMIIQGNTGFLAQS